MRTAAFLTALVAGPLLCAGPAVAAPADFPDVDAHPAVDPATYEVFGAHPSTSGWVFSTQAGLLCRNSLIPDLGVYCMVPTSDEASGWRAVAVSLTIPGEFLASDDGPGAGADAFPLLPTGSKIAAGNGVVCAALDDATLACRAATPDSWSADTPDPPDRHYGEHGFVLGPEGGTAY